MTASIDMTNEKIYERFFDSPNSPRLLKTPPPPINNHDYPEHRIEDDVTIESLLSKDLMNSIESNYTDRSMSSNENLQLQLLKTVQELKESHQRLEIKQEQSHTLMMKMFKQLLRSNQKNRRPVRSTKRNTEIRFSTDERSTTRSNQEVSILPPKFTSTISKENRNQTKSIREQTKSNDQPFTIPDEIDKIRSEKNQGKIQIGQWCYEINVGTAVEPPTLSAATDHVTSTIRAGSPVINENQAESIEESTSNSMIDQLSRQFTTDNGNTSNPHECIELSLLHPLNEQLIEKKTDRYFELMDCFSKPPELIVSGGSLPDDAHIELAMIFRSLQGCFHNVFQFVVDKRDKSQDKDIFSLPITRSNGRSPQRIPLKNVYIRRGVYSKLNNGKTFILKSYPSGEPHDTKITGQKALKEAYKLEKLQLAIRAIKDKRLISNKAILYSNLLFEMKQPVPDPPNTSVTIPCRTSISFDCNNRCQMGYSGEIPKRFCCTLKSGYKWLKILIITDDKLSTMYKIDLANGIIDNPGYINITNKSIEISFVIVKQPLSEMIDTTTTFHIEIHLLHSESFPSHSSIEYDPKCILHKSEEFIEENSSSIEQMCIQETVVHGGQKRTNEHVDLPRLPVCKAAKISENNQ